MLNDIYNKRIIELAGNIPRLGRLAAPDASATAHSKLCGSTVKVDLKMDGPVVTDFAHDVKACALGQASSSIMARHVVGSTASELRELRETVRKMLKENGSPPQGKWADIALLEPVRDYKARHASTMLTFDAVVDAIGQIEAKAKQPARSRLKQFRCHFRQRELAELGPRSVKRATKFARALLCRRRRDAAGRSQRFGGLGRFRRLRVISASPATADETILHGFGASSAPVHGATSTRGSTSATRSVVARLVSRNSSRDNSCRSSHGGTLSDSDSRSPAPPMSKVYLASRPMSRSTIIRSCAE